MTTATTSTHLYKKQLRTLLGGDTYADLLAVDRQIYVCLFKVSGFSFTSVSTNTGADWWTNNEVTIDANTNYTRVPINCNASNTSWTWPSFLLASEPNLQISNAADITFNVPGSTNWGTIYGAGLVDSPTNGNLIYYSALTSAKTVSSGDGAPKILVGQMRITRA